MTGSEEIKPGMEKHFPTIPTRGKSWIETQIFFILRLMILLLLHRAFEGEYCLSGHLHSFTLRDFSPK